MIREVAAIAAHLPDLTVDIRPMLIYRGQRQAWAFDPETTEVWVEDTEATALADRILAALRALTGHHKIRRSDCDGSALLRVV